MKFEQSLKKWVGITLITLLLTHLAATSGVQANNPAFFISSSPACAVTTQVSGMMNESKTLYICIDGQNEGDGFLGAEVQLSYSSKILGVSNIQCTNFNSCVNLSEPGKIKLLGSSAPLPEGKAVNSKQKLGQFTVKFLSEGSATLAYTLTKIVNEQGQIENRTGISAQAQVTALPEPPQEKPQNEEVKENEPLPVPLPEEPKIEPPQPPQIAGLQSVVISPLSKVGQPGQKIQIVATALYKDGRPNENITSCFPCPTGGNPTVQGKTTYQVVSGPATIQWSKLVISPQAKSGQIVKVKATFKDDKSGTIATSTIRNVQVYLPPIPKPFEPPKPEVKPAPETPWSWQPAAPKNESEAWAQKALEKPLQENSSLPIPSAPQDDQCTLNYLPSIDSDEDGLSDRTECYLKTQPQQQDTDADSCFDGDEIHLFYTNPLMKDDCSLDNILRDFVLITDPKPDWTVSALEIHGLVPTGTQRVELTAFPSIHKSFRPVMEQFAKLAQQLQNKTSTADRLAQIEVLKQSVETLKKENDSQSSSAHQTLIQELENFLRRTPENMIANLNQAKGITQRFEALQTKGLFLGSVDSFKSVGVGNEATLGFELKPQNELADGTYDLIAIAQHAEGILSSRPVRITLDQQIEVQKPKPERLDKIQLRFNGDELLSNLQIRIENGRPILSGKAVYGAQVFATWESLALASSILADSSEGLFDIQAPRNLEANMNHKISLYALLTDQAGKARSETVDIHFYIDNPRSMTPYFIAIIFVVLIVLSGLVAFRRMKNIDALPPEHRAKENELYEAFGEAPHVNKEELKHHQEKEDEVEAAFKANSEVDPDTRK